MSPMPLLGLDVALQCSHEDGQKVPKARFLDRLALGKKKGGPVASTKAGRYEWEASLVQFRALRPEQFADEDEPDEALQAATQELLAEVAAWLAMQPRGVFEALREDGLDVRLYVGVMLADGDLELSLPPALLAACGAAGVPIDVLSDD